MQTVYIINKTQEEHLARVKAEMMKLGAPTIRVYNTGDCYIALEGSHRIVAAAELGLTPEWIEMDENDEMEHDIYDVDGNRVSDLLEYIGFGSDVVKFENY